jgi:hypothetical protein
MSALITRNGVVGTRLADGLDTILSHSTWDVAASAYFSLFFPCLILYALVIAIDTTLLRYCSGLDSICCWFRYPMLVIF